MRRSTTTPWWSQMLTLFQYRSRYNYSDPAWLGPRIMDKLVFTFIIFTLYLRIGSNFSADNVVNLSSSLFMWTTLPAFGAASYVPSIVLGECLAPAFPAVRCRAQPSLPALAALKSCIGSAQSRMFCGVSQLPYHGLQCWLLMLLLPPDHVCNLPFHPCPQSAACSSVSVRTACTPSLPTS